jgi:hypothetical protein
MSKGIKAIKQAGVYNFLGKQKMITVPIKWKSGKDHPDTELAYITKPEKELLIKLDLHGSMKDGKPNKGPGGIISLNSGGSGNGGSSGASSGGTDTGDMGSEAANNAATDAANASVGIGGGPTDPGIATDTITSFSNNLAANIQSNPLMAAISPLGTVALTAVQTNQARNMLSNANPQAPTGAEGDGSDENKPYKAVIPSSTNLEYTSPFFNLSSQPTPNYIFQPLGNPYNYQNPNLYKFNKGGIVDVFSWYCQ